MNTIKKLSIDDTHFKDIYEGYRVNNTYLFGKKLVIDKLDFNSQN